jgi:hypothetical protein
MAASTNPIEDAIQAGFDISLIEESLSYSHEKRLLQHQAALDLVLEMERAGQTLRERTESTAAASVRR